MVEISSSPQRAHFAAKFLLKSERCANLMFGAKNFCRNFSTKIILKVAKKNKKSHGKNPRLGLLCMSCIIFFCNELLALQKRKKESTTLGFLRSYLPDLRLSLCKMCALFLSPSMHPATKITDSIFEDVHEKSTPWILQAAESTTVSKQSKRSSHPRFSWHIHSVVFPE